MKNGSPEPGSLMTPSAAPSTLDWDALVVPLTRLEIVQATCYCPANALWHHLRVMMTGEPLEERYKALVAWLNSATEENARTRWVQVANYVNALRRGGLVK